MWLVQHKNRAPTKKDIFSTHVIISTQSESYGGDVEGVGDEVDNVPHVAHVLLQPNIPQLLDLTPYQACHPNLVAISDDFPTRSHLVQFSEVILKDQAKYD